MAKLEDTISRFFGGNDGIFGNRLLIIVVLCFSVFHRQNYIIKTAEVGNILLFYGKNWAFAMILCIFLFLLL